MAALAVGTLGAGCGGRPPPALRGTPQEVVRAAASRTMAARTARVDITLAVDTAGTGMAGTGVADLAAGAAQLTLGRTGAAAHLGGRFSVVVDGPTDYVRVSDGRWLTGAPRQLAIQEHTRISPLDTLLVRPGAATDLAFLRGAVKVLPYGGQEIRGVSTTRYSLVVDLPLAVANSPAAERPALEAADQAIGPVLWPVDVWLDAQGRVRHLEMAEDPEARTTTTKGNVVVFRDTGNPLPFTDLDFYDFGTPAKISVPSGDQVVEVG